MRSGMALIFSFLVLNTVRADIYIIIYATHNGNTGHCGIAVDEYEVRILDKILAGQISYIHDTIKTGALTYYDFWPLKDVYKGRYDGDVEPAYYKLPSSAYKQMISLKTLMDEGVPHKFGYPCDAILSIVTSKHQDFDLMEFLNEKMRAFRSFNSMQYNCCDYVADALVHVTGKKINAKEFVVKDFVTTPNEMYKQISAWSGVAIVKDPGDKINGSFFHERILSRILPVLTVFQLFINIPNSL